MKLDYSEINNNKNNNNNLNTTPPLKSVPDNYALVLPGSKGGSPGKHGIILNENADPESCLLFTQYTNKISGGSSSTMVCADFESSSENVNKFTCVDADGNPHDCCPNDGDYLIIQSGNELVCSTGGDYPEKKYGCVSGSGGMCVERPGGQYDTLQACEENCSRLSIGFDNWTYLGQNSPLDWHPKNWCENIPPNSGYQCVQSDCSGNICFWGYKPTFCELDVKNDLMSGKEDIGDTRCLRIDKTIAEKCPQIKTTSNVGSCGLAEDPRNNCNISSIVNPRNYSTKISGVPAKCGWFGFPCGWADEVSSPGKPNYCEGLATGCGTPWPCCSGGPMLTLDRQGAEWHYDYTKGDGGVNQPACSLQLKKLPPVPP